MTSTFVANLVIVTTFCLHIYCPDLMKNKILKLKRVHTFIDQFIYVLIFLNVGAMILESHESLRLAYGILSHYINCYFQYGISLQNWPCSI